MNTETKLREVIDNALHEIKIILDKGHGLGPVYAKILWDEMNRRAPAPEARLSEEVEEALEAFEADINLGLSSTRVLGRVLAAEVRRLSERGGMGR